MRQYTKPFSKPSERNGALAFARSLLNDQDWFESLWKRKDTLQDKPILLIWGMADPIITLKNFEKFKSGFPNAKVVKLESAGHFPQEEEPEKGMENIRDIISGYS